MSRPDIETVKLYLRGVEGCVNSPRLPCGTVSAGPAAGPASRERWAPPPPLSGPNPQVFENLRLRLIIAGPRPALRGRTASPGMGLGSSSPYAVRMSPGLDGSVAIPGRAVKSVVL